MRILAQTFIVRVLSLFATVLVAALILLATVEIVLHFDDLVDRSHSSDPVASSSSLSPSAPGAASSQAQTTEAASMGRATMIKRSVSGLWTRLASYYLPDLLPISGFIAVFVALAWAGRAMELVAIEAGGIRLTRIVAPILATGMILSLASLILHETVILDAHRAVDLSADQRADRIDLDRESFWIHKGRTIANIARADPVTRTLFGVEIFERDDVGRVARVIRAPWAVIKDDGRWQVFQAEVWRFDAERESNRAAFQQVDSVILDLSVSLGDSLLGSSPRLLSLPQLAVRMEAEGARPGPRFDELRGRYHERLSQPWLVFLFFLMAMPFGLAVDPTGRIALPAFSAILCVGTFYFVRGAGETLAQQGLFPVGWAPWLSIGLFASASLAGLYRTRL